jgi:recombinational DNA repair protein (RecF pathway)
VAELLDVLTADADPQPELFDVAQATLRQLSDWRGDEQPLVPLLLRTELAMLRLVGHEAETACCVECRGPLPATGRVAFGMLEGGTLCDRCRGGRRAVVSLSAAGLALLRQLQRNSAAALPASSPAIAGEVRAVMTTYLAHLLGRPTRVAPRLKSAGRRRIT